MAVAGAEVAEGHLVSAADFGIHVVDLTGEAVWRKPPHYRIRFEESAIDAFGRSAQDTVKMDGSSSHGVFSFS
jgi:hypothetical protein